MGDALLNSLLLAALSTFIQLPLALIIALKLSKGIRGERAYLSIFFMPVLISTVIIGRLWMNIYDPGQAGLLNAGLRALGIDKWLFPAITNSIKSSKLPFTGQWTGFRETALIAAFIPILWQYVGYHMLLMYAGIKGVPADLLEAAQLDGCTEGQVNRFIIIPYIKPILKVCVIFAVTGSLKSFDLIYALMKDTSRAELPSTLMYKLLFLHQRYGLGSAIAVVLIVLCFLFAVLISFAFRDKGAKVA
jgi:raffinose/stachyose/melibiose transport system permease protein